MAKAYKPFDPTALHKAMRALKESEANGTHSNKILCSQCGQKRNPLESNALEVNPGVGYATRLVCVWCAAEMGDESAIKSVAKLLREVPSF